MGVRARIDTVELGDEQAFRLEKKMEGEGETAVLARKDMVRSGDELQGSNKHGRVPTAAGAMPPKARPCGGVPRASG